MSSCRTVEHSHGSVPQGGGVRRERGPGQYQLREGLGGGALCQRTAGCPETQGVHVSESFSFTYTMNGKGNILHYGEVELEIACRILQIHMHICWFKLHIPSSSILPLSFVGPV